MSVWLRHAETWVESTNPLYKRLVSGGFDPSAWLQGKFCGPNCSQEQPDVCTRLCEHGHITMMLVQSMPSWD